MGKALKVFVVLNLLVSAGVVALSTLTFLERGVLKSRALELEETSRTLSLNLKWGDEVAWETPEEKKPIPFSLAQPVSVQDLPALKDDLNELSRFATQRQAQLTQRHTELNLTQDTLAKTQAELASTERQLAAARSQEASLTQQLADTRQELSDTQATLVRETATKESREDEISRKNDNITELNNQLASLEIDLETRIQQRDLAQAEYDRCRIGAAGDREGKSGDIRGKRATVMAVNPDWEYVVIDIGMANKVEPKLEALVHRGKEYVGKLQVVRVEDTVSVAEIVPGSVVSEDGIRPGDKLFF